MFAARGRHGDEFSLAEFKPLFIRLRLARQRPEIFNGIQAFTNNHALIPAF